MFKIGEIVTINSNAKIGIPSHVGELAEIVDDSRTTNYDYQIRLLSDGQVIPVRKDEISKTVENDPLLKVRVGDIMTIKHSGESGVVTQIHYPVRHVELRSSDGKYGVFDFSDLIHEESQEIKIALTAKIGAGKDTVAARLKDKYGFQQFGFGDALKRHLREIFGDLEPKREHYQIFGQLCRKIDPKVWIKHCHRSILASNAKRVVINDLRQPNEYEFCKREGFIIVRVECDENIRIERAKKRGDSFKLEDLHHETEQFVDMYDVDYVITNNGTLFSLYRQVDDMMKNILDSCLQK